MIAPAAILRQNGSDDRRLARPVDQMRYDEAARSKYRNRIRPGGSEHDAAHSTRKETHMSAQQTFVIVGAGLAGAKAAEALRTKGFGGNVILIGDEDARPYDRPPLSKGYLLGSTEREKIYIHPAKWHTEHDIDLRPEKHLHRDGT
jgi:hypothetical protein